jgi:Protein of unknown function DUF262
MSGPSYLSAPVVERLPILLRQIAAGEYRFPRFRRPFIWRDEQRLLLLDSIMRGFPIGSILIWRTSKNWLQEYKRLGPFSLPECDPSAVRSYVIDGHQRLVTLFASLSEPVDVQGQLMNEDADDGADGPRWPIYYDLESQMFLVAPRRTRIREAWFPLSKMQNNISLYEYQKHLLDKGLRQLASRVDGLTERFKDYSVPISPIATEDLDLVTECFRRVNGGGTAMSEVHMANAVSWTGEFDLLARFGAVKEKLQPSGWGEIDEQVLLDALKVSESLDYYHATPEEFDEVLKRDPGVLDGLSIRFEGAIAFLKDYCGVCGPATLPYQLQLILLVEAVRTLGRSIDGPLIERFQRWFWQTTFTEFFTGSSNADVRRAVDVVRAMAGGDVTELPSELYGAVMPNSRFRANAVRSRAIALLLASHCPLDANGEQLDAPELLSELGAKALPKILPSSSLPHGVSGEGPENRWIVPPRGLKAMREILQGEPILWRDKILESHVLSSRTTHLLSIGDVAGFLDARRRDLIAMERRFVEEVGLSYAEQYETIQQG